MKEHRTVLSAFRQWIQRIPDRRLGLMLIALAAPAFLWNLHLMPFIGDEGIRSLVALEMKLSGNYVMPTLNGEPYYNKPPLYNWVLLAISWLWGSFGEWPARLTTLLFLGLFAWTVYRFHRRHYNELIALSAAFMLLTCGRILFWDSMLGLIDIGFSWIIYLNFILWYEWAGRGRWSRLFLVSYLLAAAGFLLKGLPAVVFQGVTVVAGLYFSGALRQRFFSAAHVAGIAAGLLVGIGYYGLYARYQPLDTVFSILLEQSMQRTPTHYSWQQSVLHLFTFPLEQVYHFLPWSLLILLFFHPRFWSWVRPVPAATARPASAFAFLQLFANIPVYWASVGVYPRYLLMFVPLFNQIGLDTLQRAEAQERSRWQAILQNVFIVLSGLGALAFLALPAVERGRQLAYWPAVWLLGALALIFCTLALATDRRRIFLWMAAALLVVRIGFNGMILPFRMEDDKASITRTDATRLAARWGDRDWRIYKETETHQVARFYTANALQKIIRKTDEANDRGIYYLVDQGLYPDFPGDSIDSLRLENGQILALMQLR